jgi:hypothetical protein
MCNLCETTDNKKEILISYMAKILDQYFTTGKITQHNLHWLIGSNNAEDNDYDTMRSAIVVACLQACKYDLILTSYEIVWLIENDMMDDIIKVAPPSKFVNLYKKKGYVLDCRWILKQYITMVNSEIYG